jgi:hypothetical protein
MMRKHETEVEVNVNDCKLFGKQWDMNRRSAVLQQMSYMQGNRNNVRGMPECKIKEWNFSIA